MPAVPAPPMGMNANHRFSIRIWAVLFVLCLFGAGCAKAERSPAPTVTAGVSAASPKNDAIVVGRALVVTEDVRVTVTDVDAAATRIRSEVARAGGYIADSSINGKDEERRATFVLRVPSSGVRDLRAALAGAGEVTSDNEKVQDVTEEHADLEARLHNARVQEKRVLEIMASKAGTIAETIDAERELARIRETIERLEAQKRALDSRIDFATVNVTLSAPATAAWQTPAKSIASAANSGVHAAKAFFTYAAMTIAAVAPTLAPFVAMGIAVAMILRRRRAVAVAR